MIKKSGQELAAATESVGSGRNLPGEAMEPCISTFVFPFFLTYGRKEEREREGGRRPATRSTHAVLREGVVGGQDRIFVERRHAKKEMERERERKGNIKRSGLKEEDEKRSKHRARKTGPWRMRHESDSRNWAERYATCRLSV